MSGQLHLTHKTEYRQGREAGRHDAATGERYMRLPTDTDSQRAYSLGYADGWMEVSES